MGLKFGYMWISLATLLLLNMEYQIHFYQYSEYNEDNPFLYYKRQFSKLL
jgi:hypothetical protein